MEALPETQSHGDTQPDLLTQRQFQTEKNEAGEYCEVTIDKNRESCINNRQYLLTCNSLRISIKVELVNVA